MKSHYGAIILEDQERYLESLLPKRDPLLEEMENYSNANGVPSSDPEVLAFLGICIRSMAANAILEIGTAIGYGAIGMARALQPGGKVTTIDPSNERISTARSFIQRAGLEERIEIIQGMALDVLPTLEGPFDLAYIDAVKEEYPAYLNLILPLLRRGGVIIADNVLWKGQVATGRLLSPNQKSSNEALRQFNRTFVSHEALQATILALGDGIAYGVKK